MIKKEVARRNYTGDDGRAYVVVASQQQTSETEMKRTRHGGGTYEFLLSDGGHLLELDDGTFEIMKTGVIIRKS